MERLLQSRKISFPGITSYLITLWHFEVVKGSILKSAFWYVKVRGKCRQCCTYIVGKVAQDRLSHLHYRIINRWASLMLSRGSVNS